MSEGITVMGSALGTSVRGSEKYRSSGGILPIPTPIGLFTLGYSSWKAWIEGLEKDHYFGFIYADGPGMGCKDQVSPNINCNNWNSSSYKKKHEFLAADRELENGKEFKLMHTAEDVYVVAGQGISGVFKPNRKEDGDYSNTMDRTSRMECDYLIICGRDKENRTEHLDSRRNLLNTIHSQSQGDIYWRYVDDVGGAEYTVPSATNRDNNAFVSVQSKIIAAKYSSAGRITGFDITSTDGTVYSFDFPVYNLVEQRKGHQGGDVNKYTNQVLQGSYAYAWLLTSVRALDYVDWTGNGFTDDDAGGWVKFTYDDGMGTLNRKPVQYWGSPYHDPYHALYNNSALLPQKLVAYSSPNPQTSTTSTYDDNIIISNSRNSTYGLKEIAYLHSVETSTHKAEFATDIRLDNQPFKVPHPFDIFEQDDDWHVSLDMGDLENVIGNTWYREYDLSVLVDAGTRLHPTTNELDLLSGEPVDVSVYFEYKLPQSEFATSCDHEKWVLDSAVFKQMPVGQTRWKNNERIYMPNDVDCGSETRITKVLVTSNKGTYNASRRLASIKLFEKAEMRDAAAAGRPPKEVSAVFFGQNYSLSPNTPNSHADNHGKLTLFSLSLARDDEEANLMPPYRFFYQHNASYQDPVTTGAQSYSWVPWETGQWDRWGNRCERCNDNYHEPDDPAQYSFHASAWNLNRIVTPSGAEISVTYGPKVYKYIGEEPVAREIGENQYEILIASGGPDMFHEYHRIDGTREDWSHYRVPLDNIREKLTARGMTIQSYRFDLKTFDEINRIAFASTPGRCTPVQGEYTNAWLMRNYTHCGHDDRLTCNAQNNGIFRFNGTFPASQVNTEAFAAGFQVWETKNRTNGDFQMYAIVTTDNDPRQDWANGTVVSDLRVREPFSNNIQHMHFEYADGMTPSLPPTFSDYGDSRTKGGRGLEFYEGNPGVTYSTVTTTVNGKHKVSHHFLTARDFPTIIPPSPDATGQTFASINVVDMSALWGALWKKVEYRDDGTPLRTTNNSWGANFDQMPLNNSWDDRLQRPGLLQEYPKAEGVNYVRTFQADEIYKPYFGQHQNIASHRHFNSNGCYASNDCPYENVLTSQVVLKRILPLPIETKVEQEGLSVRTHSYYHDFRSGRALKSRVENSDGSVQVSEVRPAYYQYRTMSEKNAISQDYATTTYMYPSASRTDFLQSEENNRAVSSSFTVWRPYDKNDARYLRIKDSDIKVFRKHRTYVWRERPGQAGTSHGIPDDRCDLWSDDDDYIDCNDAVQSLSQRWVMTERVNRYDANSHATDVSDNRGVNQTTLYAYDRGLPAAFLQNTPFPPNGPTRTLQAFYESFEGYSEYKPRLTSWSDPARHALNGNLAKTGKYSLEVKNVSSSGTLICFDMGVLEPGRGYEASVWYFDATPGTNTQDGNATRPGIFLGKNDGCSSEYHPNGVAGSGPVSGGGGGSGEGATGSRTWKRISTLVAPGQCNVESELDPTILCVYASKGNSGRNVLYDELRVKPVGSKMTTFAYDGNGKMVSAADVRETTTHFEYDKAGNMSGIRNDDGTLISEQSKRIGKR